MLDEQRADDSLERVMKMAEDECLKAKTKEEKEAAYEKYLKLHHIYNDRLKIQNDRYVAEARNELDLEKMENEKERQAFIDIEEKKSKSKDRWIKIGLKVGEFGFLAAGFVVQAIIIHNNMIESDSISKATSKGFMNRLTDYFRT